MEENTKKDSRFAVRTVDDFEKSKNTMQQKTEVKPKETTEDKQMQDTAPQKQDSAEQFKRLGIVEPMLKTIAEEGFEEPTEIQRRSVPLVVAGKDVMAKAATGSGKTLAFAAGIVQNTTKGKGLQSIVLTPTRELADQVATALKMFSRHKSLRIVTIYGGVPINPQINAIRSADVVVGTPGRLLDHMGRNTIGLGAINTLVLDEADRMLDMGFIYDVERIINACPKQRQTLLFSATLSTGVNTLARKYMKEPQEVYAESYVDPKKLTQIYYDVPDNLKFSLLVHMLKHEKAKLVMVFCNTRRFVDFVANNLKHAGIDAIAIHGGLPQAKRSKTMNSFHAEKTQVLVCTDVAARGLDIPHVSHIYNYDTPKESKQYIHRIGRTARAGKEGKVINIISPRDHENFMKVIKDTSVTIKRLERPHVENIRVQRTESRGPRSGGGRRGPSRGRPRQGGSRRGPPRGGKRR